MAETSIEFQMSRSGQHSTAMVAAFSPFLAESQIATGVTPFGPVTMLLGMTEARLAYLLSLALPEEVRLQVQARERAQQEARDAAAAEEMRKEQERQANLAALLERHPELQKPLEREPEAQPVIEKPKAAYPTTRAGRAALAAQRKANMPAAATKAPAKKASVRKPAKTGAGGANGRSKRSVLVGA